MKKLLFPIFCALVFTNAFAQISKEERSKAIGHLKTTNSTLLKTVKGLSDAQLNFKATEESWSIAECIEHIAISEKNIFGIVEMTMKNEPDPSLRNEVSFSDEQVLGFIESREQKVKTQKPFEPTNQFGGPKGSLEAFKSLRKSNMKFVKSSKEDLRNRYFDFPFGKLDAYQVVLFMSGHTRRHTDQIKEVMANANFPAS